MNRHLVVCPFSKQGDTQSGYSWVRAVQNGCVPNWERRNFFNLCFCGRGAWGKVQSEVGVSHHLSVHLTTIHILVMYALGISFWCGITYIIFGQIFMRSLCKCFWKNVFYNNALRIMTFSNYSCHVTPLYKNLNVLKKNDIYRLESVKFMHKLHHGALPKIYNFFKIFLMFILTKQDSLTTKIILYKHSMQRICAKLWKKLRSGKNSNRVRKPCHMSHSLSIIRIIS